jgi:hypothetical protein
MDWADLFDRGDEYGVSVAAVRESLAAHREERS